MEKIEYIVVKRQSTLDYLKRVHQGSVHWLNVITLSRSDINEFHEKTFLVKRSEQWFFLALSLCRLLELPNGPVIVRACVQLLEEFEYFSTHSMVSEARG